MTQETTKPSASEFDLKQAQYDERHRFWTGQALSQFGNANNYFIIVGLAMLGYFLEELGGKGRLVFTGQKVDNSTTRLVLSSIFVFISVLCGTLVLLSRLYDLRLTRHIMTIRKAGYSEEFGYKLFSDDFIDIRNKKKYPMYAYGWLKNFITTIWKRDYYIEDEELSQIAVYEKFRKLRKRTLMLSSFSWMCFSWQIFWLSLSVVVYFFILIAK
ncbi:MAG: hypothetical protein KA479_11145 [Saprospiraceae bacterium]|nr:hypothetical protein [Saprospiraceae bacterium]